ncbi:MAG: NAD(P)-dependent oxidoreductase [Bacteroidia bacterium]
MSLHILITEHFDTHLFQQLEAEGYTYLHLVAPFEGLQEALRHTTLWIQRGAIPVTSELLTCAPNLNLIIRGGSGVEHIDLEALRRRGIQLYTTPHANAPTVAEHCLALLLALIRRIPYHQKALKSRLWSRKAFLAPELFSLSVGILGYGHTGKAFAHLLRQLGVQVWVYDKYKRGIEEKGIRQVTLQELQKQVDVVSFHLPLTPQTIHFADARFWAGFAKPIYVLNASRGEILVLEDLIDALQKGRILGAGIDVFPQEPPFDLPVWEKLLRREEVILTPHVAGLSQESERRLAEAIIALVMTHDQPYAPAYYQRWV